jgi:hypothetical protein
VNDSILQGNLVQQTGSSGVIGKPLNAVSNTNIQGAGKQIAANAATPSADSIAQIQSDSDYNNLPSGTRFTGPDGKVRVKP